MKNKMTMARKIWLMCFISAIISYSAFGVIRHGIGARLGQFGGGAAPLPYDREVKRLIGDGTAWIDSGIVCDIGSAFGVEMRVCYTSYPTANVRFGNAGGLGVGVTKGANGKWYNGYVSSNLVGSIIPTDITIYYDPSVSATVYYHFSNGNGTDDITRPSIMAIVAENTYVLYAFRAVSGFSIQSNVEYEYIKITKGGTLVRDYIPVVKDGVGYMYDRVSGELFGNAASSGAFTWQEL